MTKIRQIRQQSKSMFIIRVFVAVAMLFICIAQIYISFHKYQRYIETSNNNASLYLGNLIYYILILLIVIVLTSLIIYDYRILKKGKELTLEDSSLVIPGIFRRKTIIGYRDIRRMKYKTSRDVLVIYFTDGLVRRNVRIYNFFEKDLEEITNLILQRVEDDTKYKKVELYENQ